MGLLIQNPRMSCYVLFTKRAALLIAILSLAITHPANAQSCPEGNPNGPNIDSASQILSGKIIFHNDLRQWFELRLDAPVCGETTVQLLPDQEHESLGRTIQTLRGCRASVHGALGLPETGYYSAEIYQKVDEIEPAHDCKKQPPFPDYSKLKPSRSLRVYRVSMWFDYGTPDSPLHVTISDGIHTLQPWQPYASYWLTGGFGLYVYCADEFAVSNFNATPEANPWLIDNQIALDPETAAEKRVHRIEINFTCRRDPAGTDTESR
jgi:hypothetical protein